MRNLVTDKGHVHGAAQIVQHIEQQEYQNSQPGHTTPGCQPGNKEKSCAGQKCQIDGAPQAAETLAELCRAARSVTGEEIDHEINQSDHQRAAAFVFNSRKDRQRQGEAFQNGLQIIFGCLEETAETGTVENRSQRAPVREHAPENLQRGLDLRANRLAGELVSVRRPVRAGTPPG